jgi:kynurenine/2-aminoadipate aminotransferase
MISLGGGLPNKTLFPITDITFGIEDYKPTTRDRWMRVREEIKLTAKELDVALQYSPTLGLPELVTQLRDLQQRHHDMNPETHDVLVTVGSQDGFCKAIEMLIDPKSEDDVVFCESPTYSGALAFLHPFCGPSQLVPIATDAHGLVPESLEEALLQQNSDEKKRRVLYTIPTAQNPSGATMSIERRHAVIQLAHDHDLMVLEDDPYYFLHPHRDTLPSLLSLDTDGRVLRLDSVSKLVSSGLRIGFVTGPKPLIEQLQLHIQATNLHNSGISQMILSKILSTWKTDNGFNHHCDRVAHFYEQRKQVMVAAAEKHLTGLAQWDVPEAGMFLWMKLPFKDTKALIETKAAQAHVLLVPGQAFDPRNQPSPYVRASFSTASDDELDTAMARLAGLIRSELE